ncbi:MAG: hypothetical protein ACOC7N_02470, partial [Chloroflexota bacterium]
MTDKTTSHRSVFLRAAFGLLMGVLSVVGLLVLLSQETSARPMLQNGAILSVTKSDDPDEVIAGNLLTYLITVTNTGDYVPSVVLTDTLPDEVAYGSATGECAYDLASHMVTCTVSPTGTDSLSATVDIYVTVDPSTRGTITNTVAVSGDTDIELTTVYAEADLAVSKSDDPDPVTAGEALTYTVSVTNNGPSDATGVTVTDTLPTDVNYDSHDATTGTYDP